MPSGAVLMAGCQPQRSVLSKNAPPPPYFVPFFLLATFLHPCGFLPKLLSFPQYNKDEEEEEEEEEEQQHKRHRKPEPGLTVRVDSPDGTRRLGRLAHSCSVLSDDPELIFAAFRQVRHCVDHVADGALVDANPARRGGGFALHDVAGDDRPSVALRGFPGQRARRPCHLAGLQLLGGVGNVCGETGG